MEEKPKGSTRNVACKIRLNDEENNILDKICKETYSTKSDVMRSALAAYYKEMMLNPAQKASDILDNAEIQGYLNGFEFSILIHNLLISENGYVIDTGNWENVNAEVALRLVKKIKKHPILWKHFFMVA